MSPSGTVPQQRRRLLLAAVVLVAALAVVLVILRSTGAERAAPQDGPAAIVHEDRGPFRAGPLPEGVDGRRAPQFALRDAHGDRVDTADLHGRPYLVTFLYTDCRDVCPLIAQEIKLALEQLDSRADEVTALAVTADPEGDTSRAVRAWLERHRMPSGFRYLLGTRAELAPVWKAHYAAPQPHDRAESAHSASIWLVDRRGRWRAKFSGGVPVPPADIAHDLRLLLDERA